MKYLAIAASAAFTMATSQAMADEIFVCDVGGDYTTIQAAVDNASAWDYITVCPGTYIEKVSIGQSKDGLTIQSQEISTRGENTFVRGFKTVFAPNSGPEYVTIKGFWIGGDGLDCDIGIESSGDNATFAFNRFDGWTGQFGGDPAVRINRGVMNNHLHHNWLDGSGTDAVGLLFEGYCEPFADGGNCGGARGPSEGHNVHHNVIENADGDCVRLADGTSKTNIHQNEIAGCGFDGIDVDDCVNCDGDAEIPAEKNHIHQNVVCDVIDLNPGTENNFVHHNVVEDIVDDGTDNKLKKNDDSGCPV